jgi:hypothetical protein
MFEVTLTFTTGTKVFQNVEQTVVYSDMYEIICSEASYLFPTRNIIAIIKRRING